MELNSSTFLFSKEVNIQLKTCINCGVVVEDNAVLFCPECGAGDLKEQPQALPEEECVSDRDTYYDDVLPEDAGQEQSKQNNTGLFVRIALVGFVVAIIVSVCAVVAFMT